MKTTVYIDGYNLFYGCLKHSSYKWLDVFKLLERILHDQDPATELLLVKYFTAPIKGKVASHGVDAVHAQVSYHRAWEHSYPGMVKVIQGFYSLEEGDMLRFKNPPDKKDRVAVWRLEEKQTDVNIALECYRDALRGEVEQIVIVSNDSDLEPALVAIRSDCSAEMRIGVVMPISESSTGAKRPPNKRLSDCADWTRKHISNLELADAQFPDTIPTLKKPIKKLAYW